MKIAVTCENHQVFQHFGHTPEFAVFEVEPGKIISEKTFSCGESGHGALAGLLEKESIDLLICGGIGGGAVNALSMAGIEVIHGAEGDVRECVEALLNGTLQVRQEGLCSHHHEGEEHTCGDHGCGNHTCGSHTCGRC